MAIRSLSSRSLNGRKSPLLYLEIRLGNSWTGLFLPFFLHISHTIIRKEGFYGFCEKPSKRRDRFSIGNVQTAADHSSRGLRTAARKQRCPAILRFTLSILYPYRRRDQVLQRDRVSDRGKGPLYALRGTICPVCGRYYCFV